MDANSFFEHREFYRRCLACRSCLEKHCLITPFEEFRLPLPWQGSVGPRVKVLFLFAKPSYAGTSPRLSDYPDSSSLQEMLARQYESHAIGFRRRTSKGAFRTHARKISSILLETPPEAVKDFEDYLFTPMVRCHAGTVSGRAARESLASECLGMHGADLVSRLPNLQWVVLVGTTAYQLVSSSRVFVKFRKAFKVKDPGRTFQLPPLAHGVSGVVALNDRVRLIAVPHFSRGVFRAGHYRKILASLFTRRSFLADGAGTGLPGVVPAAGPAALPG